MLTPLKCSVYILYCQNNDGIKDFSPKFILLKMEVKSSEAQILCKGR